MRNGQIRIRLPIRVTSIAMRGSAPAFCVGARVEAGHQHLDENVSGQSQREGGQRIGARDRVAAVERAVLEQAPRMIGSAATISAAVAGSVSTVDSSIARFCVLFAPAPSPPGSAG